MKKDLINFYYGKNILISEVVKRGAKQLLNEAQILEGLEKVYDRVQSGEKIKDISLVWEAWEEAKKSQGKDYLEWLKSRDEYMAEISDLRLSNSNFKTLIWFSISAVIVILILKVIFSYV